MVESSVDMLSYQQFIESLPLPAYACDAEGYVQICNEKAIELLGKAPLPGMEKWTQCWAACLPDGTPIDLEALTGSDIPGLEMLVHSADGHRRYVRLYARAVQGPDGQIIGSTHVVTDITEEKKKEEKAALLAAIVQSSEDAIISKTLEGIITSWNEGATRIFGYSAEEMIGQHITKLIPQDRLEEEPSIIERLKQGERVEHFETKRIKKNRELIDISLTISPVMDSSGAIIGASKVARDISIPLETNRKIREKEQLFRMAVEATDIGSWEYYPDGSLVWSDEARKIWGIEPDEKLDVKSIEAQTLPEDWELLKRVAFEAMMSDGQFQVKMGLRRADDGELRWARVQGRVIFGENGHPERYIGTMLDITADKNFTDRLEEIVNERTSELIALNQQLKRSNHDLEQFAYIASHDLQEPLRKIQTFAELIERNIQDPSKLEHYARRIKISTRRMSGLIRDVLNYSRLSKVPGRLEDINLNVILKNVLSGLNREIVLSGALVHVNKLPVIKGNEDQLYQLFHNLISNSLKFCNRSPVVHINAMQPRDGQIEIVLKDNGIGFEQQYAEKIFHIFSHLNPIEQYNGTGIGLALCRKIVENHGGVITAIGVPGEGATIYISLPC